MNRLFRLPLLMVVCAIAVFAFAGPAAAVTLSPTSSPLPGSNFQGGDGDQDNPLTGTNVDWQSVPNTPGDRDLINPDKAFAGGDKETEPGVWGFQDEGSGVNPNKDNILGAWSDSRNSISGTPSTFLNLAFTREASTGNTYITFELNQKTF